MNKNYVCSDLHGMLPLWRQIQEFCDETDTIYVLGDAADRGPDSWETLKAVLDDPRVVYVLGNHDTMLINVWRQPDNYYAMNLWYSNGGHITHSQMMKDDMVGEYMDKLARCSYLKTHCRPDGTWVTLSHAGFSWDKDGLPPAQQSLLWDRSHWKDKIVCHNPDNWVVCGHTPVPSTFIKERAADRCDAFGINDTETVARYAYKILVDGGCFRTGRIALLDLDTFEEEVFTVDMGAQ